MTNWCGTCCAIIMIRLPRDVDVLAVLVIGSFLTWIFCSCYFLFFFFHFWFLSLGFIFERNCFEKTFLKKSRATNIIFRTKFKISSKLFSVLFFLFRQKLRILQFYSWDMWLFSIYDIRKTIYLDLGQVETCSNNQNSKLFLNWIFDKKYHLF